MNFYLFRRFKGALTFLAIVFFILPFTTHAQGLLPQPTGGCPKELECYLGKCVLSGAMSSGTPSADALPCNYTISDILQTAVNGLQLIFGITGSIALLMFMYGGFLWLISGGSAEKIKQGTGILKNSVIAIIIILGASLIVRFVASDLFGVKVTPGSKVEISGAECTIEKDGTACGKNLECFREACVSKCEQRASTDAGHTGYSCQSKTALDNIGQNGGCEEGLCPGEKDNQCCIDSEYKKDIEKAKK